MKQHFTWVYYGYCTALATFYVVGLLEQWYIQTLFHSMRHCVHDTCFSRCLMLSCMWFHHPAWITLATAIAVAGGIAKAVGRDLSPGKLPW